MPEKRIPFQVWIDGVRYGAWFVVHPDRQIELLSAYGSARRPLGRRRAEKVAEEMLAEVVKGR